MKLNFEVQLYDEVHLMNYEFLGKIPVRTMKKFIKIWIKFVIRHSLRLNADVADTALQKSFRQFCKYCQPNLNYEKNYIFINNTFSMLKFTSFC